MTPKAFRTREQFRAWLEAHHATAAELLVRCFKVHARGKGITYGEALDEALCFGWIDGVRRSVDDDSFSVRFSPRRRGSYWSAVNRRRAAALEAEGRMTAAGLAALRRGRHSEERYSFEAREVALSPAFERQLRTNERAWAFFRQQPPWYRRTSAFWVMSAKQEQTRARRLAQLIDCSEQQRPIGPLARAKRR
jgi:uncharacterized protein YdeI (YjbR/CyaY-like superfamily)